MNEPDFHGVCEQMRLSSGLSWTVPITCSVDRDTAARIELGAPLVLTDDADRPLALMTVEEKYRHDKRKECETVYRTTDEAHPGVAVTLSQGDVCLSGPLEVLSARHAPDWPQFRLTPAQTRAGFAERGWTTAVAFQTRNPIHRAHEYITKCALEICDGLLVHPLVGQTQKGDIPADVRMRCYEVLMEKYYPADRVVLGVKPAKMHYAGPREAVLHAIVRRNYGATHFIVGRDHAGAGDYYGTYDAQKIFETIDIDELGIEPLMFEHTFWCNACEGLASNKTCPHEKEDRLFLSGTAVREMLGNGQRPPHEFSRDEVADILIDAYKED
jgi:sulfate adenylyltransferase